MKRDLLEPYLFSCHRNIYLYNLYFLEKVAIGYINLNDEYIKKSTKRNIFFKSYDHNIIILIQKYQKVKTKTLKLTISRWLARTRQPSVRTRQTLPLHIRHRGRQ